MMIVDTEKCGECPFYRKKGFFRRERCDFPKVPVPGACPLLDDGPRVIPYDEAMRREVVWIEWRQTGDVEMVLPVEITGEMYLQSVAEIHRARDVAPRRSDGVLYRFWDGRPGEEERGGDTVGRMICTKEAREICDLAYMCEENAEVADDSECADLIVKMEMVKWS